MLWILLCVLSTGLLLAFLTVASRSASGFSLEGWTRNTPIIRRSEIVIVSWQAVIKRRPAEHVTVDSASPACEDNKDLSCRRASFALDLLRISRLFNPTALVYLLADKEVMENNTYYRQELARLKVAVRYREGFRSKNESRAAAYDARHYADTHQQHPPEMLSRFCEVADLAKAEALERVLVIDADVGLFSDVEQLFRLYKEDIVTPCVYCSQVALWSISALDRFCDGLISFWQQSEQDRSEVFAKYGVNDTFNDMDYLSMFLTHEPYAHNLSVSILTNEAPCARNPMPNLWAAGVTAMMLQPNLLSTPAGWYNASHFNTMTTQPCDKFGGLVYFAPVAWSAPYAVPLLTDLHLSLPLIHFQQACKYAFVHRIFLEHYRQFGFAFAG